MLPGYAQRLAALRVERGMNSCVLAVAAGLQDHMVLDHEAERKTPTLSTLIALAKVLCVPPGLLAFGERAVPGAADPGPETTFAARLRGARQRSGDAWNAIAKRAGSTRGLLLKWEAGQVDWPGIYAEHVLAVARALAVCPRWLAFGELPPARVEPKP